MAAVRCLALKMTRALPALAAQRGLAFGLRPLSSVSLGSGSGLAASLRAGAAAGCAQLARGGQQQVTAAPPPRQQRRQAFRTQAAAGAAADASAGNGVVVTQVGLTLTRVHGAGSLLSVCCRPHACPHHRAAAAAAPSSWHTPAPACARRLQPPQERKAGSGKISEASGRGQIDTNPPRGTRDFFPEVRPMGSGLSMLDTWVRPTTARCGLLSRGSGLQSLAVLQAPAHPPPSVPPPLPACLPASPLAGQAPAELAVWRV